MPQICRRLITRPRRGPAMRDLSLHRDLRGENVTPLFSSIAQKLLRSKNVSRLGWRVAMQLTRSYVMVNRGKHLETCMRTM